MSGRFLGGTDPEEWTVDATLTGAQTVYECSAPRAAWLHVIRDAEPDYPWRGVSPLQRATVSAQLVRMSEDALVDRDEPADQVDYTDATGRRYRHEHACGEVLRNKAYNTVLPDHHGSRMGGRPRVRSADGLEAVAPQADA